MLKHHTSCTLSEEIFARRNCKLYPFCDHQNYSKITKINPSKFLKTVNLKNECLQNLSKIDEPQKLEYLSDTMSFNYVFSGTSIIFVICLSEKISIFTEIILNTTK